MRTRKHALRLLVSHVSHTYCAYCAYYAFPDLLLLCSLQVPNLAGSSGRAARHMILPTRTPTHAL